MTGRTTPRGTRPPDRRPPHGTDPWLVPIAIGVVVLVAWVVALTLLLT